MTPSREDGRSSDTVVIGGRFCGPAGTGNGGYTAGVAAAPLGYDAEVTLFLPPPVDVPLDRVTTDGTVQLRHGDDLFVEARATRLDLEIPEPPSFEEAGAAHVRFPWLDNHAWPSCFVCGTGRAPGDGLRIWPGSVGDDRVATVWRPDRSLVGADGLIAPEFVWSALDCPTATAVIPDDAEMPSVLGRLTARVLGRVEVDRPYIVLAWPVSSAGRKRTGAAALIDPDGTVVGISQGVWIELRPETMEQRTA